MATNTTNVLTPARLIGIQAALLSSPAYTRQLLDRSVLNGDDTKQSLFRVAFAY